MTIGTVFGLGTLPEKNINSDIQGKYSNTYFRIRGNGYDGGSRTPWPKHVEAAYDYEVENIFITQGWIITEPKKSGYCPTATKSRSSLYLHPQNFSGVCENAERNTLYKALTKAGTFKCDRVDVYDEVHDMTDEQLEALLRSKKGIIENNLLEAFITKRRNLYITSVGFFGVDGEIAKRYSIKRLAIEGQIGYNGQDNRTDGICYTFVSDILGELVNSGKIITAQTKNGMGYRTANKNDLMKKAV